MNANLTKDQEAVLMIMYIASGREAPIDKMVSKFGIAPRGAKILEMLSKLKGAFQANLNVEKIVQDVMGWDMPKVHMTLAELTASGHLGRDPQVLS